MLSLTVSAGAWLGNMREGMLSVNNDSYNKLTAILIMSGVFPDPGELHPRPFSHHWIHPVYDA